MTTEHDEAECPYCGVTAEAGVFAEAIRLQRQRSEAREILRALTPRELEVLNLLASGHKSKAVGIALGIGARVDHSMFT